MPPQQLQSTPQATPQSGGLDPQLVNLAKAIRQTESGGNFQAKGQSGEYGAYQFEPTTWAAKSQAAGINVPLQQATPQQQNEVAYKTLATWKQQHPDWNIGNFASAWNAGEGRPNAYLQNNAGVNQFGASYDTGAYAKKVATAYQQFKGQPTAGVNQPAPQSAPQQSGGGLGGFFGGLVDAGLPIAGGILGGLAGAAAGAPAFGIGALGGGTAGAAIGATGGAALANIFDQLTGRRQLSPLQAAAEPLLMGGATAASGGASEALEGLTGLGGLAARTAAQGAIGATYGGAQSAVEGGNVQQGALTGALFGGAGNLAGEALGAGISHFADKTPENRLGALSDSLTSLSNASEKYSSPARDAVGNIMRDAQGQIVMRAPEDVMSDEGLIPFLKVVDGKVQTEDVASQIDNLKNSISNEVTQRVDSMSGLDTEDLGDGMTLQGEATNGISLEDYRQAALNKVANDPRVLGTGDINRVMQQIDSKISGLQAAYGDQVSWKDLNNIRIQMNKVYNPDTMDVERVLGDTSRDLLYGSTGDPQLKALLSREGTLIKTQDFVQRLQGKAIKGGRLGKYIAELAGGGVGALVGAPFGPFGQGGAAVLGGAVGDRVLNRIQSQYFDPIGASKAQALQGFIGQPGVQGGVATAKLQLLKALLGSSSSASIGQ